MVWMEPGKVMCSHDRKTGAYYCFDGPGCTFCKDSQNHGMMTPTVYPGSSWESFDGDSTNDHKTSVPSCSGTGLDYNSLPCDLEAELDQNTEIDPLVENEKAKSHPLFPQFMAWLIAKYELPDDHIWGTPEEPVEDLKDFIVWLVEMGLGKYRDGDVHMDEPSSYANETRMH